MLLQMKSTPGQKLALSAGTGHTAAVRADGKLVCCGRRAQCAMPADMGNSADGCQTFCFTFGSDDELTTQMFD